METASRSQSRFRRLLKRRLSHSDPGCDQSQQLPVRRDDRSQQSLSLLPSQNMNPSLPAFPPVHVLERKGGGSFGVVLKAVVHGTNTTIAVKKSTRPTDEDILHELEIMRHLPRHENLLHLLHFGVDGQHRALLGLELCKFDLGQFVNSTPHPLDANVVRDIMRQLFRGVRELHRCGIVHRDLKPENLLLTENMTLKIADFGCARKLDASGSASSTTMGTTWYTPPEALLGSTRVTRATDSWSCGLILAYLLTGGAQLFGCASNHVHDVFERIVQVLGSPSRTFLQRVLRDASHGTVLPQIITTNGVGLRRAVPRAPRDALALMEELIVFEPERRISADEALDSRFIRDRPGSRSSSIPPSTRLNAVPSSVPNPALLRYGPSLTPQPMVAAHPVPTPVPHGLVPSCVPPAPQRQMAFQQVPMMHPVRPPSIVVITPQRTPPAPNIQPLPSPQYQYQPPTATYQMVSAVPRLAYIQPAIVPQMTFAQPQPQVLPHQTQLLHQQQQQQVYYYPASSVRV